ncbi:hypothetical protein [Nitrosomonas sp. sh817]|uniref:hypothetical protein n=1 Tax=Nitrosomonas sp. sh817 TaxID=3070658 RepID=UPI0027DC304F|nr:hypothetical protein [Nitrosomonas sp. sh817]WMJ07390.1 hypothetical protein RBH92_08025 [Nitrosomonas sp. sh817]
MAGSIKPEDDRNKHAYEHDDREPKPVCYDERIAKRDSAYDDTQVIANSIEELQCHIKLETENPNKHLQILAVMVPNGPYAEDKEWRLRTRYAVVAALTELGYTPEDPEHIDYVDFDRTCKTALQELRGNRNDQELKRKTHFCHMGSVMPYEWFSKNKQETILLLWLDNGGFVNPDNRIPLKMLGFLKSEVLSKFDRKYNFNIIGPFGSGALDTMYREVFALNEKDKKSKYYNNLEDTSFYVAAATVDFEKVYPGRNNKNWLDQKIIRTIGTQDNLANLLLCELALRGVTPYHVGTGTTLSDNCSVRLSLDEFRHRGYDSPHHIVLIGERDTYYSQRLTDTFLDAIKKFDVKEKDKTPWIHTYSYLRGLDGITSEHAPSGHKESKNKNHEQQANNTNAAEAREQMERPVGPSQLDYLLNLAGQIKRLDKQYAHEGGIKAIGITGHDAYDKLLILQALRLQFPGVLFFTTDLDARFLHPSEIKWTRNLLVASPFGLQLNEDFQKKTPPFRENYQTSLFLAAQLALCKDKEKQKNSECNSDIFRVDRTEWTDKPRLFEIGNEGAVNISHEPNRFLDSYDGDFQRFIKDSQLITIDEKIRFEKYYDNYELKTLLSSFAMMILMAVLVITFFTPKDFRKLLICFVFVLVFCSAIAYFVFEIDFEFKNQLEPLSFTNGTSMWPSVLMKVMAILLAAYFFYRIHNKLSVSFGDTRKQYLQPDEKQGDLENERDKTFNCSGAEKISIDCWRDDLLNEKIKNKRGNEDEQKIKNNQKIEDKKPIKFSTLWDEYRCWGKWEFTWKRVSIALLVTSALVIATLFTSLNDVTFHHIRGQSNYEINLWWFGLATLSYVLLILYVAERVHLSSHFIRLLANPKIEIDWPEAVRKTYRNKYGLPEEVVRYRILLDFINHHTSVPNKFIYYPFFCLFLIVMSRNYYFENWPTTPFVLVVYAFFALLTLISAIRLRVAAVYARDQILDKLENNSADAPVNATWHQDQGNAFKFQSFISEIRDFKEGIYRPLAYHPMVLNLLVPFSSIGGIYLIEYLI